MPSVDFMIIGDYVRNDNGVLHIIAGGINTFHIQSVPYAQNVGIGLRLLLTRAECDQEHLVEIAFQDEDGTMLARIGGQFRAAYPEGLPPGAECPALLALNLGVPIPKVGRYTFELFIDGTNAKAIPVTATTLPPPGAGGVATDG